MNKKQLIFIFVSLLIMLPGCITYNKKYTKDLYPIWKCGTPPGGYPELSNDREWEKKRGSNWKHKRTHPISPQYPYGGLLIDGHE